MSAHEQLRLLLDSDMSSHSLVRILETAGHDVLAAGLRDELKQLDDRILFAFAQHEERVMITHNLADFPGRVHHGCILSALPTNAFGEMERRFEIWFGHFPSPGQWLDRAVYL
jgi:hypothetical protein